MPNREPAIVFESPVRTRAALGRSSQGEGTAVVSVIVDELGRPRNVRVQRSLGLGLDQKAVEAVSQWKFKPGLKDGKPVPVFATIEVNFRLL